MTRPFDRLTRRRPSRLELRGAIAGVGFSSGDRFVAGIWDDGPLGPMTDVMWARPDGARVLLVPHEEAGRFVGGIYRFERTEVVAIAVARPDSDTLRIDAGPVSLTLSLGADNPLFGLRPAVLRRSLAWVRLEDALLRPVVGRWLLEGAAGVNAYGRSASGVREWYRVDGYRPVSAARGTLGGRDLGAMAPLDPRVRFGFSEFPRRPALVRCSPVLEGAERFLPSPPQSGSTTSLVR